MIVKIKGKNIQLTDWQLAGPHSKNLVRRREVISVNPDECIGLMVSYKEISDDFNWLPFFYGPDMHCLAEIYFQMYPSPKPYFACKNGHCILFPCKKCNIEFYPSLSPTLITFSSNETEEAKQHLDQFINRVNALAVFL